MKRMINVNIEDTSLALLDQYAEKTGYSRAAVIRQAVNNFNNAPEIYLDDLIDCQYIRICPTMASLKIIKHIAVTKDISLGQLIAEVLGAYTKGVAEHAERTAKEGGAE